MHALPPQSLRQRQPCPAHSHTSAGHHHYSSQPLGPFSTNDILWAITIFNRIMNAYHYRLVINFNSVMFYVHRDSDAKYPHKNSSRVAGHPTSVPNAVMRMWHTQTLTFDCSLLNLMLWVNFFFVVDTTTLSNYILCPPTKWSCSVELASAFIGV